MPLKICMFVYNNCQHDSRVLKEAATLAKAGHEVRIVALLDDNSLPYEERNGFTIIRTLKNPLHYRVLKRIRYHGLLEHIQYFLGLTVKPLYHLVKWTVELAVKSSGMSTKSKTDPDPESNNSSKVNPFKKLFLLSVSISNEITQKGVKTYIKNSRQHSPTYFFTFGWFFVICFIAFRYSCKFYYRFVRRPLKILWVRHMKKTFAFIDYKIVNFIHSTIKNCLMKFHRPLCFLDYYCRSLPLVMSNPADVYHAHDLNTLPIAYWAKKKTKASLVYDSHEFYVERNRPNKASRIGKFLLKQLEGFFIKSSDHVITVSDSIGVELQKRYSVKKLSIILNVPMLNGTSDSVRNSECSLHHELDIPETDRIVLYVGNIAFNRGLENLIQSLVYLNNCILVMMGKATEVYVEKLKKVAIDSGVSEKVHFFGPVPQEQVIAYASSADIGAAPILNACLSYYYSLPNKLFECMNAGLPTIGSNFPELKKVIEGYGIGKTFDPENPKDIAASINYILSDRLRYDTMRKNSLQAAKIFNWSNESKKLLTIYNDLEDRLSKDDNHNLVLNNETTL